MKLPRLCSAVLALIVACSIPVIAADLPEILTSKNVQSKVFLPDFSYAGYSNGEQAPDTKNYRVVNVADHGIHADDGLDDSQALIALLESLEKDARPTVVQFNRGQYILSSIIYIGRSNLVLRGAGSGISGTELYFPRPLIYVPPPAELEELREYLVGLNKVQKEPKNNIYLPFTEWSWTGGFLWARVEGERVKRYLGKYDKPRTVLAKALKGQQGEFSLSVDASKNIKKGDVIEIQWYNNGGENGEFLDELYPEKVEKIGSHHWNFKELPLARQQVVVSGIKDNVLTLKAPLLNNVTLQRRVEIAEWKHLENVGFEHFALRFPYAEPVAHHVEQGFNGMYLTRLFDSWVDDIRIINADSGILTEEVANMSIRNISTEGEKLAHYTVQMGAVHNVLVDNLAVKNRARHPLSFNTFATRSVYHNCKVDHDPVLDQHSGVNQQNLFDNIQVDVQLSGDERSYPLFAGGGAGYWKPSHAAYNTFWNIQIHFENGHDSDKAVLLDGMNDGPRARVVGVKANLPLTVEYGPNAYIEGLNEEFSAAPSLYNYQLKQRLNK